ncbi:aminotransferase-like domain-containing protein [Microscilla marina]|uniref:Transcriptional regulator, GntR family/aminotransferase, classes I and II family protein n=1 Tax=Microscilla marina ATCC 23134 TaxID=313606 RepID=A1ZD83_MICM2|nr:PLP-dependent aminotransferase family protein [Microscilla marina]EAY31622.1 transcriptional regulator, GntR family/aminotransferase, classes I and II family protein [Microscilla marina ATCC 23134]
MKSTQEFLYLQIAQSIEQQIVSGTLPVGHKLPSVRVLCQQQQVSPSTVFNAYYRLETMGLIEARPKSGYYVRQSRAVQRMQRYQEILPSPQKLPPLNPSVSDIIDDIEQFNQLSGVTSFAPATPALQMLPGQKLQKSVREVMRKYSDECLNYAPVHGLACLREQILLHGAHWGFRGSPHEVLVTAGCLEAISLCLQALTRPGDLIITETLTYFGIQQLIQNLGLKVAPVAIHPETGLDMKHITTLLKAHKVKACLFTSNFHNPTAYSLPNEQKQWLAQLAASHQIPVIEDDVYGEVYFGKQRPTTIKRYDTEGWVIYCSSFSKMLSPGYRLGYCLPGRFMQQVARQKRIHSIATSSLVQYTLSHFLQKGRFSYHLKKLRQTLYLNMLKYEQCIDAYFPAETYFAPPQGGYVFWIGFAPNTNTYKLYLSAKAHHIGIVPGQLFSLGKQYKNFIRLSFATPFDQKIEESLKKLGKLANNLNIS